MEITTEVREVRVHSLIVSDEEAQAIVADPREFVQALRRLVGAANGHRINGYGRQGGIKRRARKAPKNRGKDGRTRTGVRCPACQMLFDNKRKLGQHKRVCAKWQLQQVEEGVKNGKE